MNNLADAVAEQGGWVWRRVGDLRPGDVQVLAGRRMTVASIHPSLKRVEVRYTDAPPRLWGSGTEVGVTNNDGDRGVVS